MFERRDEALARPTANPRVVGNHRRLVSVVIIRGTAALPSAPPITPTASPPIISAARRPQKVSAAQQPFSGQLT